MASIKADKASGNFRIHFRCQGRQFQRSLKTTSVREARGALGRVEETIRLIERGRLTIPDSADPAEFILSDGRISEPVSKAKKIRFGELVTAYQTSLPKGAKEQTTLDSEELHFQHLKKHLGSKTVVTGISVADVQKYVEKRSKDTYRDKPIAVDTIKKEIATFRMLWNWAMSHQGLEQPCPTRGIKYPKRDAKPPFMTLTEIQRRIDRGGLSDDEVTELWACLFLSTDEVEQLLQDVGLSARHDHIFPMFLFAAHTGARRSEIMRSQIDDFDFELRVVHIREKKRSRSQSTTFRQVPMSERLAEGMKKWFGNHPGGQLTISRGEKSLSSDDMTNHFKAALANTSWSGKVKGFHMFRHSFASNAAAAGVNPGMIDSWMGHQTEEMRNRYRHLFPRQQKKAIDSVFGRTATSGSVTDTMSVNA